jgi:hypothetical protein
MLCRILSCVAATLLIASLGNPASAAESRKNQNSKSPSIEGTYKLVSRKLADGKVLSGQEVVGLFTYTKTHRNFNIAWKDGSGRHWSQSVVSTYVLTSTQYTETPLLTITTDEIGGKGTKYTMAGSPQTVPVKVDGGRIEFKMPFDPVTSVFVGDKFTSTNEGVFVDTWEKVK